MSRLIDQRTGVVGASVVTQIGVPGRDGEDGQDGAPGVPGLAGVAGADGPQGPPGPFMPGDDGRDGMDGFPGQPGADGAAGATGAGGAPGTNGYTIRGEDGQDGFDGFQGPQGNPGATGSTGADGAAGPQGYTIRGEDGQDGFDGFQGPQGNPGATGDTGASGADGPQGYTIRGEDGADGADGVPAPSSLLGPYITTIESGSLPAAATLSIINIPANFTKLVLVLTGASSNTATRQVLVRVSTNNGVSYDSTAGNYVGHKVTGTTWANYTTNALASLIDSVTVTAAQVFNATIQIDGYQGGPNALIHARVTANAVEYRNFATYIGSVSPINALQVLWNGTGNFDAGTYALYGIG